MLVRQAGRLWRVAWRPSRKAWGHWKAVRRPSTRAWRFWRAEGCRDSESKKKGGKALGQPGGQTCGHRVRGLARRPGWRMMPLASPLRTLGWRTTPGWRATPLARLGLRVTTLTSPLRRLGWRVMTPSCSKRPVPLGGWVRGRRCMWDWRPGGRQTGGRDWTGHHQLDEGEKGRTGRHQLDLGSRTWTYRWLDTECRSQTHC